MTDAADAFRNYLAGIPMEDQFERDTMRRRFEEICVDLPGLSEQLMFIWDFIDFFRTNYVNNGKAIDDDLLRLKQAGVGLAEALGTMKEMLSELHKRLLVLETNRREDNG